MKIPEDVILVGDAMYHRAGCRLLPFLPTRGGGRLVVTREAIRFEPILHWALYVRQLTIPLAEVAGALAHGPMVELSVMRFVTVGRRLTIFLKGGGSFEFRSLRAEAMSEGINNLLGLPADWKPGAPAGPGDQGGHPRPRAGEGGANEPAIP